jgi:hypothetical protein
MIILEIIEGKECFIKSDISEVYKRYEIIDNYEYNLSFISRIHKNEVFKIHFKHKINNEEIENIEEEESEEKISFTPKIMRAIANGIALAARDALLEGSAVGACWVITNSNYSKH